MGETAGIGGHQAGSLNFSYWALNILFHLPQSVKSKQKFIFLPKAGKKRNFCGQQKECCPLLTD
jgi:hypothetical protein